jgi:hypothetical protein
LWTLIGIWSISLLLVVVTLNWGWGLYYFKNQVGRVWAWSARGTGHSPHGRVMMPESQK